MHIKRLRLVGFKSFVEPTELLIEPGLTGVVGPNGCGKSNLLEALRWVMGETSHKSMRAASMDDVIFSGTQGRPARNHAEVSILLDNSARTAPAEINDSDQIEVVRRIERDAGSLYRLNGRDARARDVRLLFEDAATGARSPALVRQGQIAEIVNAKPEQRRRVLEDAAGTAGLHSRRHDAELRLKAAEGNLARVGDVLGQLASQIAGLKRQARQARRYKEISEEIRQSEAVLLLLGWRLAEASVAAEEQALLEALGLVAAATEAESEAVRTEAAAAEAIAPLREAEVVRAAVCQRTTTALEQIDRDAARVAERTRELAARIIQLRQDEAREAALVEEAGASIAALGEERARLETAQAAEGEAHLQLAAGLERANATLAAAEEAFGRLTGELAEARANRRRIESLGEDEGRQLERLSRSQAEVDTELARLEATLPGPDVDGLAVALESGLGAVAAIERKLAETEARLAEAARTEEEKRAASALHRLSAEKLRTEAETLRRLLAPAGEGRFQPVLDRLKVERGWETALAAALGEDLDAALDVEAPVHWCEMVPDQPDAALPESVQALAARVKGPSALGRRLAQIGVVATRQDGERLRPLLRPGQRLVTRDGDLWRWDGLVALGEAPTAAARRLAQRNRLDELDGEITAIGAVTERAEREHAAAVALRQRLAGEERQLRAEGRAAHGAVTEARARHERAERQQREATARRDHLRERLALIVAERKERSGRLLALEAELAGLEDLRPREAALEAQKASVAAMRQAASEAIAAVAGIERERRQRRERLAAIAADGERWQHRSRKAREQCEALAARLAEARAELTGLEGQPEILARRREAGLAAIAAAEAARRAAADALAAADTAQREAARAVKERQSRLGELREGKARVEARLEAARERRQTESRRIRETLGCDPDGVPAAAGLAPDQDLPELPDLERRLTRLREDRERLGGVNLQAESELEGLTRQHDSLDRERVDLEEAIARLRQAIAKLNREGRRRLSEAFAQVDAHFQRLFATLFGGGEARLELIEGEDPLEGGLEIVAKPPGKKPATLSLLSGGEQTLTALSLIFAVFLTNPSPICVLDEVDAPLDDANVDRFCKLMEEMAGTTDTRFLVITHHPMTMSRVHRLYGVTMVEKGVSQLVSVDLATAESYREAG